MQGATSAPRRTRTGAAGDLKTCWPPLIRLPARRCSANARPATASEKGGANQVGPNLWNVVDGLIAHREGFSYSPALAARVAVSGPMTT